MYLRIELHTSGDTWGTVKWVPQDGLWSRLDSAIAYAEASVSLIRNYAFGWRVIAPETGEVFAEGR